MHRQPTRMNENGVGAFQPAGVHTASLLTTSQLRRDKRVRLCRNVRSACSVRFGRSERHESETICLSHKTNGSEGRDRSCCRIARAPVAAHGRRAGRRRDPARSCRAETCTQDEHAVPAELGADRRGGARIRERVWQLQRHATRKRGSLGPGQVAGIEFADRDVSVVVEDVRRRLWADRLRGREGRRRS